MTQLDSTTLSIGFKAFGVKTKVFAGSAMMFLCCSYQERSQDTKHLCAMNSDMQHPISLVLQKKKCLLLLLPSEMEEVAMLGNRLWLMPPLN